MSILICLDRDGTVNVDKEYYLGSQENWKELVEFLPGVVEGIKALNSIKDTFIVITTNQAGVAINEFSIFNEKRMHEVNEYIIDQLRKQGALIYGYVACPYVDKKYRDKKQGTFTINPVYLEDHPHLKPKPGMVLHWKKHFKENHEVHEFEQIYVIGDRMSDMQMGKAVDAECILVPSTKTKVQPVDHDNVEVAKDFSEAVEMIKHQVDVIRS